VTEIQCNKPDRPLIVWSGLAQKLCPTSALRS